jgi:succinyl-CoA synthetase alpha subunit
MRQLVTKPFPYFVGIYSLEELATKATRVCVLNILGNESRKVTPVSHEYSGGNVVVGVQYGRHGLLETKIGNIPVHRSVRDVMNAGIAFDAGVIYLPPQAVSQAVWELIRFNKELKRIVIVTEKVSTRDSMNIRFICQEAGVDVIGANSLGVLNAWDHVRIGGALGGDHPEETMQKGSVAIHSNSGNFTTTIADYLRQAGFGVSTAVSSGKDVYIHFALPEFLFAAQNDPRTKAVAVYVEPGGYYEKMALDWIRERRIGFHKPIVVCVTGRWKKEITRSCGHAGAIVGSGDDAESKEKWFDDYFGVGVFDPKQPKVSKNGVRVASIHHFPDAMKAVFKAIDEKSDFEPSGNLFLKLWISDDVFKLPPELDIPVVKAIPPYNKQITEMTRHVGAVYIRQNMRNKSGASRINPKTQVAELHGKPVLELSTNSFEENVYFALAKVPATKNDVRMMNVLLNLFLKINAKQMELVLAGRADGCTPNAALASPIALIGNRPILEKTIQYVKGIIDLIRQYGISEQTVSFPKDMDNRIVKQFLLKTVPAEDPFVEKLINEINPSSIPHRAFQIYQHIDELAAQHRMSIRDRGELLLATMVIFLFWTPMLQKRISRQVVEDAIFYIYVIAQIAAYSVIQPETNTFWKTWTSETHWNGDAGFTEILFNILFNRKPDPLELVELKYLLGLTLTNGPGTLSAQGAKESVSARNAISMAFVGF